MLWFPPTVGVDNRNFQSYHNPVNSGSWHSCRLWHLELPKKSWHSCSFQSYLTAGRCYASRQLSELTTVAFRVTFQKRNITSLHFGSKIPLLLFLLWVTHSLLKATGLKPFRTSVAKLALLSCGVFSDRKTFELSIGTCKITGITKNYTIMFMSPLPWWSDYSLTSLVAIFPYAMWWGLGVKNKKNNIFHIANS